MNKISKMTINATKKLVVIIMISMIILSSFSYVKGFTANDLGGKLYDDSIMPSSWINQVKERAANSQYSQTKRMEPNFFDCSSFVCRMTQLYLGEPEIKPGGSATTTTMPSDPRFEEISPSEIRPWDILWKSGHTEFYIGQGKVFGAFQEGTPNGEGNAGGQYEKAFRIKGTGASKWATSGADEKVYDPDQAYKTPFFYEGIKSGTPSQAKSFFEKIVLFLKNILAFILNALVYAVRLPIIGFTSLVEIALHQMLEATVGDQEIVATSSDPAYYIDSKRAVNIENIIFDRVELLKVDIFESPAEAAERLRDLTGTGQSISEINEKSEKIGVSNISKTYDRDTITEEDYRESAMGLIRSSAASVYYLLISLAITFLLVALIFAAIKALIATTGIGKAKGKELAVIWLKAVVLTFIGIIITVIIVKTNNALINVLYNAFKGDEAKTLGLYEQIRTDAYDFRSTVGVPATAIYMMLVWYTIRFLIVYIKRLIAVIVLAVFGSLIPVYSAIKEVITGKSEIYSKWIKELAFNVFIQPIHVLIYVVFVNAILATFQTHKTLSIVMVIIIFKMMLEFSKKIRDMFGWETGKSSILSGVLDETSNTLGAISLMASSYRKEGWKNFKKLAKGANVGVSETLRTTYNATRAIYERFPRSSKEENSPELPGVGNGPINLDDEEARRMKEEYDAEGLPYSYDDDGQLIPLNYESIEAKDLITQELDRNLEDKRVERTLYEKAKDFGQLLQRKAQALNLDNYAETDVYGRRRIRNRKKGDDPATGEKVKRETLLTQMHKKFTADSKGKNKGKDDVTLLRTAGKTLMGSLSVVSGIVAMPMFITDPKETIALHNIVFNGAGVEAFSNYLKVIKEDKKNGYKTPDFIRRDARKRFSNARTILVGKIFKGYKRPEEFTIGPDSPISEREFKLTGIGVYSIEEKVIESIVSMRIQDRESLFLDVGVLKLHPIDGPHHKDKVLRLADSKVVDEARKVAAVEADKTKIVVSVIMRDAENTINSVFNATADESEKDEVIRIGNYNDLTMVQAGKQMERAIMPGPIKTSSFIDKVKAYNAVSGNVDPNDADQLLLLQQRELEVTEMLTQKVLEVVAKRNGAGIVGDDNLIESEITRLLEENEVELKDDTVILAAAESAREQVASIIESEVELRTSEAVNGISYKAENVSNEFSNMTDKARGKDINELTLEELNALRLDRAIGSFEAYRVAHNYREGFDLGDPTVTSEEHRVHKKLFKKSRDESRKKAKAANERDRDKERQEKKRRKAEAKAAGETFEEEPDSVVGDFRLSKRLGLSRHTRARNRLKRKRENAKTRNEARDKKDEEKRNKGK